MQMNINCWWTGVHLVFEAYCGHRILTCLPVTSGQWWNPLLFYIHTATSAIQQPLTYEQEIELTVVPIEILGRQETLLDLLIIRVSCKFAMA